MDERKHFQRFKGLHRQMVVGSIEHRRHTSSNGGSSGKKMQGVLHHLPESLPAKQHWRERLRSWWFRLEREWESVKQVVAKTEGKYQISQPLLLVFIGVLGTAFFAYWWRSTDTQQLQRDKIIVLETLLQTEREKNIDQDSKIDQARNFATRAGNDVAELKGKFDQFALTYSIKNAAKTNGGSSQ